MSILGSGKSFLGGEAADAQPLIRTGYKNCTRRSYLFRLRFDLPHGSLKIAAQANEVFSQFEQGWIQLEKGMQTAFLFVLTNTIANYELSNHSTSLDVAFTFSGLKKLGVHHDALEVFRKKSPSFYENAYQRAPRHLGDCGLSSPEQWDGAYRETQSSALDLILVAHFAAHTSSTPFTKNDPLIVKFEKSLLEAIFSVGLSHHFPPRSAPWDYPWIEDAQPIDQDGTVHFGFKDGITAPSYQTSPPGEIKGHRATHALGEVLLGYPRNDGDNPYADLSMTRKAQADYALHPVPADQRWVNFFKNSSFGVSRRIEQRLDVFEQWLEAQAQKNFNPDKAYGFAVDPDGEYGVSKRWIKSKMLGRTPAGRMFTPDMSLSDLQLKAEQTWLDCSQNKVLLGQEMGFHADDARFSPAKASDEQGRGCPFSSHIRRMNPRDDSVTPFIHRPVLRRSMPYTDADGEKGLAGLFICADITEQFEHLVGVWADHGVMGIPDDSVCKDPLIGNHEPQRNRFYTDSHQSTDKTKLLLFEQPFTVTRGTAYVWFPALSVLRAMAQGEYLASPR